MKCDFLNQKKAIYCGGCGSQLRTEKTENKMLVAVKQGESLRVGDNIITYLGIDRNIHGVNLYINDSKNVNISLFERTESTSLGDGITVKVPLLVEDHVVLDIKAPEGVDIKNNLNEEAGGVWKYIFAIAMTLIMSVMVAFILFSIGLDADKSIWAGTFIFTFYGVFNIYMEGDKFKRFTDLTEYNGMFPVKLLVITTLSIIMLAFTQLAYGFISSYLVDYCDKDSIFYDAKQCAIKDAREIINNKYPTDDF